MPRHASAGALLDLAGGGSFAGALSGAGTIALASTLTLSAGATLSGALIVETANVKIYTNTKLVESAAATLSINATAKKTVTLSGPSTASFASAGTLDGVGAGTADVSVAFINSGDVFGNAGTLSFLGAVTNNGTIDAANGVLTVSTAVGGAGLMELGASGTLSLKLGAVATQNVDFRASTGLLDLTAPNDFLGLLNGFSGADKIDLLNTPATGFSFNGGILTVMDGTRVEASLHFASSFTQSEFNLASDGHGGTLITFV